MTSLVTARGVTKRFGNLVAVDNVSFSIDEGKILGLFGPNGAGKTTLLKAILGLTDCDGELSVLGYDPFRQRKELMRNICFIADVAVLPRWIKVRQLLDFVEATHPNFSRSRVEELLARTKIMKESKVRELSKGMVTQLHLSIITAIDAKLLIERLAATRPPADARFSSRLTRSRRSRIFSPTSCLSMTAGYCLTRPWMISQGGISN